MSAFDLRPLSPFGVEVRVAPGTAFDDVPAADLHDWVAAHKLVVFRGLAPIAKRDLPRAARRLGPLQVWPFGAVHELVEDGAKKNYLYSNHEVPLHYDGAFTRRVPRYLVFSCEAAPGGGEGGETTFVDTTRVFARADDATKDRWRALAFDYETEKVVHYGGRFTARVVAQHPHTGETVLRFAEPVDDVNPVRVRARGLDPLASAATVTELRRALRAEGALLAHAWRPGDVVVADNHALLHGRNAFVTSAPRRILRVNVHDPEARGVGAWHRDATRIRRPEFMVAEIPILLAPALLLTRKLAELATPVFAATAAAFFLLFHFGDMTNCLADRELDAVYKTRLSEAVLGLGVRSVRRQIAVTAAAALALAAFVARATGRLDIVLLAVLGLALGAAYSFEPVRLKRRGVVQIAALWAVIFVGPMLLASRALTGRLLPELALFAATYGAMQEGTILVNTAEDLPEDRDAGVRTSAVALGLGRTLAVALAMVVAGGAGVAAALAWMVREGRGSPWAL
ncbi:MAG TPA: TauD/TfdA family dioxygenase, partial [Minicystis sp.]|nr:TauD/TfdA family dioxygenase [Minicystis sp.]